MDTLMYMPIKYELSQVSKSKR